MADIASILGIGEKKKGSQNFPAGGGSEAPPPPPPPPPNPPNRATQKLLGKSRELMGLLDGPSTSTSKKQDPNSAPLPPAVPTFPFKSEKLTGEPNEPGAVKVGNRWIKIQTPARKWAWAPFSSSSRTDGTLFHHWVRANVEYPDYPYARFDIHLDPITYTDEEYQSFLVSDSWTKSETDRLMELARRLELRWPVIYDRWIETYYTDVPSSENGDCPPTVQRKIEDLQYRFYQVAAVLNQAAIKLESATEAQILAAATPDPSREDSKAATEHLLYETAAARQLAAMEGSQQPLIACPGTGTSNKVFDLEYERQRRSYMEALWNRTKEEEEEERELRKELKQVEAQLRKIKKSGGHILAARAAAGAATPTSGTNSRPASPAQDPFGGGAANPSTLDEAFASTAPVPMPGTPYLQSGRLVPPAAGGSSGLNKSLLARLEAVLNDLKVPERPLPTKRCCDLYDSVRKDAITLLLVQKNVLQKEGLLQSKRMRLEKLTGNVHITEELVLGIPLTATGAASKPKLASKASSKAGGGKSAPNAGSTVTTASKPKGGGGKKLPPPQVPSMELDKTGFDPNIAPVPTAGKTVKHGGKQASGKQVPGGKQVKKAAPKRKRKADTAAASKPTVPATPGASAHAAEDTASAATGQKKEQGLASSAVPVASTVAPTPATEVQQSPQPTTEAPKSSGKKRPRKSLS